MFLLQALLIPHTPVKNWRVSPRETTSLVRAIVLFTILREHQIRRDVPALFAGGGQFAYVMLVDRNTCVQRSASLKHIVATDVVCLVLSLQGQWNFCIGCVVSDFGERQKSVRFNYVTLQSSL